MNGSGWKKWHKSRPRPKKDDIRDAKSALRWWKPVNMAIKHARKVLKEIKKADVGGSDSCGFWYDVNDGGGYREMCLAGGRCEGRCDDRCPKALAERLLNALCGDN